MSQGKRKYRRLRVQLLEHRAMLAGIVHVEFDGSLLTMFGGGSDNGNQIGTSAGSPGKTSVEVTAIGSTRLAKIDGELVDAVAFLLETGDDVEIDLAGGENKVVFADAILPGDVEIVTGAAEDIIEMVNTDVAGDLTVASGSGDDAITMTGAAGDRNEIGGRFKVNAHGGEDTVDDTGSRGLSRILTGSGPDTLSVTGSDFDATLRIRTGTGSDSATVDANTIDMHLDATTAGGHDFFGAAGNVIGGDLLLDTAAGSDFVNLVSNSMDAFLILTGAGHDALLMNSNTATGHSFADTGTGSDLIDLDLNTFTEQVDMSMGLLDGPHAGDTFMAHDNDLIVLVVNGVTATLEFTGGNSGVLDVDTELPPN